MVEETVVGVVQTESLEENTVVGINLQGTEPIFEKMEEDNRETEQPQEKGVENVTPKGPAMAPESFRGNVEVSRPPEKDVGATPELRRRERK